MYPPIDSSGLSYYDTDAEDDTIGVIEPDAQATDWFTQRMQAAQEYYENETLTDADTFLEDGNTITNDDNDNGDSRPQPTARGMAAAAASGPSSSSAPTTGNRPTTVVTPNQALMPPRHSRGPVGPKQSTRRTTSYTTPQAAANVAPPVPSQPSPTFVPGYIFVTEGHSSSIHTSQNKKNKKPSKNKTLPQPAKPLSDDGVSASTNAPGGRSRHESRRGPAVSGILD